MLTSRSQCFRPQNCEKTSFRRLSRPVHGTCHGSPGHLMLVLPAPALQGHKLVVVPPLRPVSPLAVPSTRPEETPGHSSAPGRGSVSSTDTFIQNGANKLRQFSVPLLPPRPERMGLQSPRKRLQDADHPPRKPGTF